MIVAVLSRLSMLTEMYQPQRPLMSAFKRSLRPKSESILHDVKTNKPLGQKSHYWTKYVQNIAKTGDLELLICLFLESARRKRNSRGLTRGQTQTKKVKRHTSGSRHSGSTQICLYNLYSENILYSHWSFYTPYGEKYSSISPKINFQAVFTQTGPPVRRHSAKYVKVVDKQTDWVSFYKTGKEQEVPWTGWSERFQHSTPIPLQPLHMCSLILLLQEAAVFRWKGFRNI